MGHENPDETTSGRSLQLRRGMFSRGKGKEDTEHAQSEQSSDRSTEDATKRSHSRWRMGILRDHETDEVPGSILLLSKVSEFNEPLGLRNIRPQTSTPSSPQSRLQGSPGSGDGTSQQIVTRNVKHTNDGKIVLEPQPDDSLNDPLNWAIWRRDVSLLSLGFYCLVGGGMTPLLAAGFNEISREFEVPIRRVALTTGLYMLGLGCGSVLLSPTAILYGKRPVYLLASLCFILTSVWCALAPDFANLVTARVFMGLAVSSVECLPSATIAEIYFLHEKAYRVGIYTLLLLGGKNLVPLVSAVIIQTLHWRWVFWIVAIVVGFASCLLFLFVPETFWDRSPRPHRSHSLRRRFSNRPRNQDTPAHDIDKDAVRQGRSANHNYSNHAAHLPPLSSGSTIDSTMSINALTLEGIGLAGNLYTKKQQDEPPKSYAQQLRPWNGRLSNANWIRVAIRPFILFAYPSILWSTLIYSLSVGWLIVLSESVSTIYQRRDTYNFTALQAGLVYISPFVGGILGSAVAGKVSDIVVRAIARRNGGVYEPEFRLVMAIPIALSTTIGLMGYGWSAHERDAWIVPTIFFGIISFGCSLGSTTSITFAIDSYRQYAGEALVTLNFSKNILHGLVFSLFFNEWLDSDGSKTVFIIIGIIQLACLMTTIPMYIYGKRARMWTVRRNLMEKF